MRGLRFSQPLNAKRFPYYRMRTLLAGDLDLAYEKFGCITWKLNLLRIVLRLAIAESPFSAMEYDRVIHSRLANLARGRYHERDRIDCLSLLPAEQSAIARNIASTSNAYLRA